MSTVLVSGLVCPHCGTGWMAQWPTEQAIQSLTMDESLMLDNYRLIRQQRGGVLFLELHDGKVNKLQVRPEVGSAQALNRALGGGGGSGECLVKSQ